MDDQDLINLQKLVGRGPQPPPSDDDPPYHIQLAQALDAMGAGRPPPDPEADQYRQALADAVANYGRQTQQTSDSPEAANLQLASYRFPGPASGGPGMDHGSADPGARYAMASPAGIDLFWQQMADQNTPPAPKPAPPSRPPSPPPQVQATIGEIPGYPETGKDAWRAANDQTFIDAVNRHNAKNGYQPGDPGYWTADKLKAQAMRESGGSRHAFETDPLQVNHNGDHVPEKKSLLGLDEGQAMTPETSADAALGWLQYKGWVHDDTGRAVRYRGDDGALQHYNANDPHYAEKVDALLNAARQTRRPAK